MQSKSIPCICLHCSSEFSIPFSDRNLPGRGRYCSRDCKYAAFRSAPKVAPERIWDRKVIEGECWLWPGAKFRRGYGNVMVYRDGARHTVTVTRLAWELTYGPIPEGMEVCHRCDRPECYRPEHLFLGTQIENMADMYAKGRGNTGSRNGQAKLTEATVAEIRQRRDGGETIKSLAAHFGVNRKTIYNATHGALWTHVS
jgi:hypothetical protein